MPLVLDLALFLGVTLGLALPTYARLPNWEPVLRLSAGVAGSMLLCAALMFAVYGANLPREFLWALPTMAVSSLVFHRRTMREFSRDKEARTALFTWLVVAAGAVLAQGLVISYSGGGWAVDWVEHYDRALFFVKGWPTDTLFLGTYPLPSRPPVANLIVAAFESVAGTGIAHYQVFATMLSSLAFLPALALAWRFDPKGRRVRTALLLALLFLISPVWMENVTFPWTKLPAAFFALLGLALIAPRDGPEERPWRIRMGWLLMAVGFLAHYSIGPWIVAALAGFTLHHRSKWETRIFWREYFITGLLCGGLIFANLSWSASHFGWKETLDSNTAIAGSSSDGASTQVHDIEGNLYRTVVPHFFRHFDKSLISQQSRLGTLRDQFFCLYQVNVLFLCGTAGLAVLAWLLTRRACLTSPRRVFWSVTIAVAIVLGIAVHSPPDLWGLAHICLQPLALIGLAAVAAGFGEVPLLLRRVAVFLFAIDFILGVAVHFLIQSFALASGPVTAASDKAFSSTLNPVANINLLWKTDRNLVFLGDYGRSLEGFTVALLALLLTGLVLLLLRNESGSGSSAGEPSTKTQPPWPGWSLVGIVGVVVSMTALHLLRSTFMMYDDEGYVLDSLKNFSAHGGLYDRVFSQYGPFYYVFFDLVHRLGWEISNTGARLLNFFEWMGACAFCSALVWRATRRTLAVACTLALSFIYLWPMISEPSHPGGFICLIVAAAAYAGSRVFERPRSVMAVLGGAAAALLFTKVNVGIFFIAGAGAWWALNTALPLPRRTVVLILGFLLALMPWMLMRALMPELWVVVYSLVVSCACCAILAVGSEEADRRLPASTGFWALAVLLAVSVATATATLLRRTTLQGLLDGVILDPLRMPLNYTGPVNWREGAAEFAIASLALAFALPYLSERLRYRVIAVGRLVASASFLFSWASMVELNDHAFAMNFGLSMAWFFVAPLRKPDAGHAGRLWLALLLVPQALHAFPVAGSQISWGTVLWIPLAVVGLWDLFDHLPVFAARIPRPIFTAAGVVAGGIMAWHVLSFYDMAQKRASEGENLDLPGADTLFLPENFTSVLRVLARNASASADVLFSLPGMYSFNLWTGIPTPTQQNATHWFTLLPEAKQDEIGRVLDHSPRACVIVQRSVYNFLRNRGIATESPLTRLIKRDFEPAFSLGTYEFWVRRGRKIAELGTARMLEGNDPAEPQYKISITLAEPELTGVDAVDFRLFIGATSRFLSRWDASNARVYVTPLTASGASAGPAHEVKFPFSASGLFRVDLLVNTVPKNILADACILYLVDARGHRLTEARFVY